MTKNQWRETSIKLLWIGVPLFISLMIWLVTMTFNTSGQIESIKQQGDERAKLQEKIYEKVEANYTILQSKADQKENKEEHAKIMNDIVILNSKMDKVYRKVNLNWTQAVPLKDSSFLWTNNKPFDLTYDSKIKN